MQTKIDLLWMRLNIIDARIQKEDTRPEPDEVRLRLLERMKESLVEELHSLQPEAVTNHQICGYAP